MMTPRQAAQLILLADDFDMRRGVATSEVFDPWPESGRRGEA